MDVSNGKRQTVMENDDLIDISTKRFKLSDFDWDVKKVAEIVLVLSAMGKMRVEKCPSDAEKELMESARRKLAIFCEGFVPKDIFNGEGFSEVIEDLGLKDQKLGFRSPNISIAEKLLVSIKKMEKAEELTLMHSSCLPGNSAQNGVQSNRISSSSDKPKNVTVVSSGTFQFGHGNAANSTSLSYQLPTSEIRPITSVPRADRPHIRSNGTSHVSANYIANSMIKTSTWPHHHSATSSNLGSNKVPVNHAELIKIVQKLLQKQNTEIPTWDPPSRSYMNKALTCQICMSTATDIDSILICDACDKGFHYAKCLGMKEVSRVEWHCAKCLSLSNGKPLPPKYGRVMRNFNMEKLLSNSDSVPASASDDKLSQSVALMKTDDVTSGSCPSNLVKPLSPSTEHVPFSNSSVISEQIPQKKSEESQLSDTLNSIDQLKDDEIRVYSSEGRSFSNGTISVKWIGDPIHVTEEKCVYNVCFINGHEYKTADHALVRFDSCKLLPAKIKAFWEDKISATRYVTTNRCYFPDDLPESIGRPCGLENNEVCESTRDHVCLASSIKGPCLVFAPRKFAQESDRRAHLVEKLNDNLPPLYLCKWIYDETKELFRDASF